MDKIEGLNPKRFRLKSCKSQHCVHQQPRVLSNCLLLLEPHSLFTLQPSQLKAVNVIVAVCGRYGMFSSLYSMSTPLTEKPFTTSKYILLHQLAKMVKLPCIFHGSIKNWIKLWEPEKCKHGNAGSQPLFFVSVRSRADINTQIEDAADELKGDTNGEKMHSGKTRSEDSILFFLITHLYRNNSS